MIQVKAKKSLGQHFLKSQDIAARIAGTLDAYRRMPILEVGPGMGVLSKHLLRLGHDLTVIELDKESVSYLNEHEPALAGRILAEDFLAFPIEKWTLDPFCLIGNYPYNISSQIFFKVLDHKDQIPCCSGMIQKEVAERIASKPGKKAYGILSVLLQAWYDIEYLFTVDPSVFDPPPSVMSGVIRMTRNETKKLDCNEVLFKQVVKTSFNQRRKMLRNSVKSLMNGDPTLYDDPIFTKRPEQLSVADFIYLTNLLEQGMG